MTDDERVSPRHVVVPDLWAKRLVRAQDDLQRLSLRRRTLAQSRVAFGGPEKRRRWLAEMAELKRRIRLNRDITVALALFINPEPEPGRPKPHPEFDDIPDRERAWRTAACLSSGPPPEAKNERPRHGGEPVAGAKSHTSGCTKAPQIYAFCTGEASPACRGEDFCASGADS